MGLRYAKRAQYRGSTRLSQCALVLSLKERDTSQNVAVKVDGANSTRGRGFVRARQLPGKPCQKKTQ